MVTAVAKIQILRMGHRPARDKRLTTHVALTARGFGADGILICGARDAKIVRSVERVVEKWGGSFSIEFCSSWKVALSDWRERGGEIIHLTMYGQPLPEALAQVRGSDKDKLIVVGAEKVPGEVYRLATYNISVTHQPISEVSALAVFLDRYFDGRELFKEFEGCRMQIHQHWTEKNMNSLSSPFSTRED